MNPAIKPKSVFRLQAQETKTCCGSGQAATPAVDRCCAPALGAKNDQFPNKEALPSEAANKVRYRIEKLCCPTEERLIRNRLEPMPGIIRLDFNLLEKELTVYHRLEYPQAIAAALDSLDMGFPYIESITLH